MNLYQSFYKHGNSHNATQAQTQQTRTCETVFRQHVWRHTCLKTFYICSWHTSQTNADQSTDSHIYIISRWHRPYMIYGEEERERHWGGAIQMHIQRDRRQSTHALVWTLTYLHLNLNGSKFFRSHSWKLQRMEIWREDLKLRNLFPPEF